VLWARERGLVESGDGLKYGSAWEVGVLVSISGLGL
jgi:hypothetical protein